MTPEELRSLADEATPGPWRVHEDEVRSPLGVVTRDPTDVDARLISLAPDLARLCAEYAGAFAQIEKLHHKDFDLAPQIARRALAKLSELKPAP